MMPAQPSPKVDRKTNAAQKPKRRIPLVKVRAKDAPARKIALPTYRSFRMSPRIRSTAPTLPSAIAVMKEALGVLRREWKLFGGIVLVYSALTFLLVQGLNIGGDLNQTKQALQAADQTKPSVITTSLALFGVLAGSSNGASNDVAALYQAILLIIVSLVIIWALRQVYAGHKVGVKESFYKGTYALVPFITVMLVMVAQLLPFVLAGFAYGVSINGGIAATVVEQMLWLALAFLLALWSIYMLTASFFALYIVTLPDVIPMQALRSARDLVRHRRWTVMRKVLFMPLALYILAVIIMLPVIILITPIANYLFLLLSMASLAIAHAYMYTLYRKML